MTIIKWYFVFFLVSALLWPSVWAGDKYIYPILWIVILWVAMGLNTGFKVSRRWKKEMWVRIPLATLLLLNLAALASVAARQVKNNIAYIQGDRYAGYPPAVKQMFLDFERARELPAGTRIVTRKPELLYIISNKQSSYPEGVIH